MVCHGDEEISDIDRAKKANLLIKKLPDDFKLEYNGLYVFISASRNQGESFQDLINRIKQRLD